MWMVLNKPDVEKSIALTPKRMDSFVYFATSRSARKSKSRQEESSGTSSKTFYNLTTLSRNWAGLYYGQILSYSNRLWLYLILFQWHHHWDGTWQSWCPTHGPRNTERSCQFACPTQKPFCRKPLIRDNIIFWILNLTIPKASSSSTRKYKSVGIGRMFKALRPFQFFRLAVQKSVARFSGW